VKISLPELTFYSLGIYFFVLIVAVKLIFATIPDAQKWSENFTVDSLLRDLLCIKISAP
jgi:hypothetical protein